MFLAYLIGNMDNNFGGAMEVVWVFLIIGASLATLIAFGRWWLK